MTIQTSDNKFATAKFIVDPVAGLGTHTTIASAISDASSGDTIVIKPGTYTEDLTLKTGVALVGYSNITFTLSTTNPNVVISGKCTYTSAGMTTISGIKLQTNSDNFLVVSGSEDSFVCLSNCYLDMPDATGITLSTTGSGSIEILGCYGDIGTTGISLFANSSSGSSIRLQRSSILNSGGSSTASTVSGAGSFLMNTSIIQFPLSISSTGRLQGANNNISSSATNTTALTITSTAATVPFIERTRISSGTAAIATIGSGATLRLVGCILESTNAAVISGAGTLQYGADTFVNGSVLTVSTQTPYVTLPGSGQAAFLATMSADMTNITAGGAVTIQFNTEVFDLGSNFNTSTYIFTAPVTGKYQLSFIIRLLDIDTAATAYQAAINTSNRNLSQIIDPTVFSGDIPNGEPLGFSALMDMDAADTAQIDLTQTGGSNQTDVRSSTYSFFSGKLEN